jgi:hypothetical protein
MFSSQQPNLRSGKVLHGEFETALLISAGELRAAIRVQHQGFLIGTLPTGHPHRFDHHMPILDA